MLEDLTAWLSEWGNWLLDGLVSILRDFVVWVIDQLGDVVVAVFGAISVPAVISAGLAPLFAPLPPSLLWIAQELGFAACFAVIGSAHGVRLIRKLATLFQW